MTEIDDERSNAKIDERVLSQRISDLEEELYNFNSHVSLMCIGLGKPIPQREIIFLNDLLGRTIKLLREIKEQ